jgi:hypothetical protein
VGNSLSAICEAENATAKGNVTWPGKSRLFFFGARSSSAADFDRISEFRRILQNCWDSMVFAVMKI